MSIFKNVNRIIFDLDNVVIKHNHRSDALCICNRLGIKEKEDFREQFVLMLQNLNLFVKDKIVTEDKVANYIEWHMPVLKQNGKTGIDFIDALCGKINDVPMDNAKEILEYLCSKDYEIVALTNWFFRSQVVILKELGVLDYFNRIYAWDNYYAKPNKGAFIRALDGCIAQNSVIIGDEILGDIAPAKRLGMNTIGFNISKEYEGIKPDVTITNLLELKEYL